MEQGIDCKGRHWVRKKIHPTGKDYTGQKRGRLTYLFPIYNESDRSHPCWLYQCDCGNLVAARSGEDGGKSCGCLSRELTRIRMSKDLTGQKFGLLTCLERLIMEDGLTYYRCKCDCGKEKIAYTSYLINGTVKSCGCLTSWKEKEIEEILTKLQIPFEQQYRIKECRDKLPLPFDFIIYNNNHYGLIEYQGKQHYIQSKQWDDIEDFQKRQKHDKIKYEYCLNNNIPLLILNHLSDLEKEIKDFYEKLEKQADKI